MTTAKESVEVNGIGAKGSRARERGLVSAFSSRKAATMIHKRAPKVVKIKRPKKRPKLTPKPPRPVPEEVEGYEPAPVGQSLRGGGPEGGPHLSL